MLTLLHPYILPMIQGYPGGLLPLRVSNGTFKLVIKAPKEVLLAARMNRGFKIYVVPIALGAVRTCGLISAFFDDADQPLILQTPLFEAEDVRDLVTALLMPELDVHMFDEHGRELLGYHAKLDQVSQTRDLLLATADVLPPFSMDAARNVLDQMPRWFSLRGPDDDTAAITFKFCEALVPDDLFIQDMRPENHSFQGSAPFSSTTLVREEPGVFQERDIALLLQRIFAPSEIYLNPRRTTDDEEIADLIVASATHVIFIQAKDSPNTEKVLQNTLDRKRATALKSLRKAVGQLRGAFRYSRSGSPMRIMVDGAEVGLPLDGRSLRGLVVVKELFSPDYSDYTPPLLQVSEEAGVPSVPLDYPELHMYTAHLRDEHSFVGALDRVYAAGRNSGTFPRLRFGLTESQSGPSPSMDSAPE